MGEHSEHKSGWLSHGGRLLVVLGLVSAGWVTFFSVWGTRRGLFSLPLSHIGDYLAGVFAPLAFVWFTAAVFYQRNEIRLSTQELRNQVIELKKRSNLHERELAIKEEDRVRVEMEAKRLACENWRAGIPEFTFVGPRVQDKGGTKVHKLVFRPVKKTLQNFRIYDPDGNLVLRSRGPVPPGTECAIDLGDDLRASLPMTWYLDCVDEPGVGHTFRLEARMANDEGLLYLLDRVKFDFIYLEPVPAEIAEVLAARGDFKFERRPRGG